MTSPQPRTFEELVQWINDLTVRIHRMLQLYSAYPQLFEVMVVQNDLPHQTLDNQNKFLLLKQEHHVFEHFLRTIKYELAIERYNLTRALSQCAPEQLQHSLDTIQPLEFMIHDYLVQNGCTLSSFCQSHLNQDTEEANIIIESQSELKNMRDCINREKQFMEAHRGQASKLESEMT
ncbi:hypothetical protein BDA99DRAFT_541536 [Phascolomyces articulosus]|uniref:Uncharacterized protein n=1 Tax=Phascolomyces articulosus TaxID=60185 RepID=A0AAD5K2A1_9FUNG|nr:hypothetical protein BDA99DRAFT_541536 [Phascolomyces articulosus]